MYLNASPLLVLYSKSFLTWSQLTFHIFIHYFLFLHWLVVHFKACYFVFSINHFTLFCPLGIPHSHHWLVSWMMATKKHIHAQPTETEWNPLWEYKVFADIIKNLEIRSSWVDSISNNNVFIRDRRGEGREWGDGHAKTEAETGFMQLRAKQHPEQSEVQKQEGLFP